MNSVYLIGVGIKGGLQMTLEAIQAIKFVDKVYILHSSSELKTEIRENYNKNLIDCANYFDEEVERAAVFKKIATDIVKEATKDEKISIGFVVSGNPLFLVSACEYLVAAEEDFGIKVRVISGVSSFDTVLSDLKIDVGYGASMYDSTLFLSDNVTPVTNIPLLLFQLATTNNTQIIHEEISVKILEPLIQKLIKFYGVEHEVTFVTSSYNIFMNAELVKIKLNDILNSTEINMSTRPTLYVPPLEQLYQVQGKFRVDAF